MSAGNAVGCARPVKVGAGLRTLIGRGLFCPFGLFGRFRHRVASWIRRLTVKSPGLAQVLSWFPCLPKSNRPSTCGRWVARTACRVTTVVLFDTPRSALIAGANATLLYHSFRQMPSFMLLSRDVTPIEYVARSFRSPQVGDFEALRRSFSPRRTMNRPNNGRASGSKGVPPVSGRPATPCVMRPSSAAVTGLLAWI